MSKTIKLFEDFLAENYRTALLTTVEIKSFKTNPPSMAKTNLYYEHLKVDKFDLALYIKSFNVKQSLDDIGAKRAGALRALVYGIPGGFVIFVFDSGIGHSKVAMAVDKVKQARNFPPIEYFDCYTKSYEGKISADSWCMPVILEGSSVVTNIDEPDIKTMSKTVNFKEKFMLTPKLWDEFKNG